MAATINNKSFPYSEEINCPHCSKPITIYDPTGSEYVVCANCLAYCRFIATNHLQYQYLVKPTKFNQVLPLGSVGILNDITYKVIGYMEKMEIINNDEFEYEWREYMLYSYQYGYAFLAEYDGHWSLIAGKQHYPEVDQAEKDGNFAYINGVSYALYNSYTPKVTALKGEYDWDAYEESVSTAEFIRPPYILISEKNKKGQHQEDWYLGKYIEAPIIAEAFKIELTQFPDKIDIGANQPNPHEQRWTHAITISVAALILMIALQVLFSIIKPTQLIMDKTVPLSLPPIVKTDSTKHDSISNSTNYVSNNIEFQPLKTSTFNIYNGLVPLKVDLGASVDNNWFEATLEVVNEKDNRTWVLNKEIDYYHGYEDGESWSEGSTTETVYLDNIPAGKYHINIYPYSGSSLTSSMVTEMSIKVTANYIIWQNLIISFLLLCIYPLICWYLKRNYEVKRWMGNYYSPYKSTTSTNE